MLTKLWPTMSAGKIGERLDRNRNSIIGKAHRMGLKKGNPKPPAAKGAKTYVNPIVVIAKKASKPLPESTPPAQPSLGNSVPLLDARRDQCRAIIGSTDDGRDLATVCGDKIVEGQSYSYCAYHLSRYTTSGRYRGGSNV